MNQEQVKLGVVIEKTDKIGNHKVRPLRQTGKIIVLSSSKADGLSPGDVVRYVVNREGDFADFANRYEPADDELTNYMERTVEEITQLQSRRIRELVLYDPSQHQEPQTRLDYPFVAIGSRKEDVRRAIRGVYCLFETDVASCKIGEFYRSLNGLWGIRYSVADDFRPNARKSSNLIDTIFIPLERLIDEVHSQNLISFSMLKRCVGAAKPDWFY